MTTTERTLTFGCGFDVDVRVDGMLVAPRHLEIKRVCTPMSDSLKLNKIEYFVRNLNIYSTIFICPHQGYRTSIINSTAWHKIPPLAYIMMGEVKIPWGKQDMLGFGPVL